MVAEERDSTIQFYFGCLQDTLVYDFALSNISRNQLIEDVENGTAQECFATHIYRNRKEFGLNDAEAMFAGKHPLYYDLYAVLNSIEGGSDTTRATLNIFAAAMATHPDFLVRVRKELDAVCGEAGRLPTFEDQDRCPLVAACIKETLRWKPFVESGLMKVFVNDRGCTSPHSGRPIRGVLLSQRNTIQYSCPCCVG